MWGVSASDGETGDDRPPSDVEMAQRLVGKQVLIGFTYMDGLSP